MDVILAAEREDRSCVFTDWKDCVWETWRRIVVLWFFRRRRRDCGFGGGSVCVEVVVAAWGVSCDKFKVSGEGGEPFSR